MVSTASNMTAEATGHQFRQWWKKYLDLEVKQIVSTFSAPVCNRHQASESHLSTYSQSIHHHAGVPGPTPIRGEHKVT